MTTTKHETTESEFVRAVAPVLPGYEMTSAEWLDLTVRLRIVAARVTQAHGPRGTALLLVDIARACDAMHNRLRGATAYTGKDELDAALGPVELVPESEARALWGDR